MAEINKVLRLKYPNPERFAKDYPSIQRGRITLPSSKPPPVGTSFNIEIHVPGMEQVFLVNGVVEKSVDEEEARLRQTRPGMVISISEKSHSALAMLEHELRADEQYRETLGLPPLEEAPAAPAEEIKLTPIEDDEVEEEEPESPPPPPREQKKSGVKPPEQPAQKPEPPAPKEKPARPPAEKPAAEQEDSGGMDDDLIAQARARISEEPRKQAKPKAAETGGGLKMEWVREVIGSEDMEIEEEEEEAPPPPPPREKKELNPTERTRVQPSGEFIMDLAKAMLRTGYYSPDHPGSQNAKTGLYESLLKALGDSKEIMLTNQETRERTDILITGILDEPVSVRTVVGAGMAELFVPKLKEYYNRKGLVSFALKKEITLEHFDAFVDVMSDPKVDRGENAKVGELLTNALVKNGITEISTVFMDDMIVLETSLPWRVEMAIQRLAKDLKVLPMFKGKTAEEIRTLKVQIVQDIIRPLRHPNLLKDIILNCYVIAGHVKSLDEEELEQTVIESFPMQMLLSTSKFIFDELKDLKKKQEEHPDSPVVKRRIAGVKRVLKLISKRVVLEEIPGAQAFLESLYFNEILTFEELPPEVQYRVNTIRLTEDVKGKPNDYIEGLLSATAEDEAMVLLRAFHRTAPLLIADGEWEVLLEIAKGVDRASRESRAFMAGGGLPAMPLIYIFVEYSDAMVLAYQKAEKEQRQAADKIISLLGPSGIEVLIKVLGAAEDKGVRKAAVDALIRLKEPALKRVRDILDDPGQVWFVQRNALLILGQLGGGEEDSKRTRKFLRHPKPRLREEALATLFKLEGKGAEQVALLALEDADPKVQRRAVTGLGTLQPLSDSTMRIILEKMKQPLPKAREEVGPHEKSLAQLVRMVGTLTSFPDRDQVEEALIELAKDRVAAKKGFLKKLKRTFEEDDDPVVIIASMEAIGKLGGQKSMEFLEGVADDESDIGKRAAETLNRMKTRSES